MVPGKRNVVYTHSTLKYVIPRERSDRGNLQYDDTKSSAFVNIEAGDCQKANCPAGAREAPLEGGGVKPRLAMTSCSEVRTPNINYNSYFFVLLQKIKNFRGRHLAKSVLYY